MRLVRLQVRYYRYLCHVIFGSSDDNDLMNVHVSVAEEDEHVEEEIDKGSFTCPSMTFYVFIF